MRSSFLPIFFAVGLSLMVAEPAGAIFGLFNNQESTIPDAAELQQQEQRAEAAFRDAKVIADAGRHSRAAKAFRNVVRDYPNTETAARAQFARAEQLQLDGKIDDAFEEYQAVIENYRGSEQFGTALKRQFELADAAKSGRKVSRLGVLKMKISNADLISMYEKIIENAPFSRYASASQFSIGEIHQDQGQRGQAVAAFSRVVERYPKSDEAEEAQFRISAINYAAADRSEDSSAIQDARDAAQSYIERNPSGERSVEATAILTQAESAQAEKDLEVAQFYEGKGNDRAAAIYYNEVIKYEGTAAAVEAQERLSEIGRENPEALAETPVADRGGNRVVSADTDVKNRDDYVGPELTRLTQRPEMRGSTADPAIPGDVAPIPYDEPDLPPLDGEGMPEGGVPLLPPPPGDDLALPEDEFEDLELPELEAEQEETGESPGDDESGPEDAGEEPEGTEAGAAEDETEGDA